MTQEIVVEGKQFISSKRAAEMSGYAQDYIGQLARKQLIEAKRVGGLWYVLLESLVSYQKQAEAFKPQPPVYKPEMNAAPDTVISFEGRDYISAARAATVTGYHQDYVGQLARSGSLLSKQIGNRWYVDREGIMSHKKSKDALLAAVQVSAVGLNKKPEDAPVQKSAQDEQFLTYFSDSGDLIPHTLHDERAETEENPAIEVAHPVPIRRIVMPQVLKAPEIWVPQTQVITKKTPIFAVAGVLATVVIVLSIGLTSIKNSSTYTLGGQLRNTAASFEAFGGLERIADFIEQHFIPELVYQRQ